MIRIFITASASALAIAIAGLSAAEAQHAGHQAGHEGDEHAHEGETLAPTLHADIEAALREGGSLVVAEVNGMVCDFCATAMTKTFGRRDEVGAVHVDLDTKTLQLVIREGRTLDDAAIADLVTRSGYETVAIRRGTGA
ncbi:MAG: heavy-metal-associated domain-containing protein [Oceanicaulis sp.]